MEETVLQLVKARLGISSTVRDQYILAIVKGVLSDLENINGLTLNGDDYGHIMFVVDFAHFRYTNVGVNDMPRHLQFRLHNLIVANVGGDGDV